MRAHSVWALLLLLVWACGTSDTSENPAIVPDTGLTIGDGGVADTGPVVHPDASIQDATSTDATPVDAGTSQQGAPIEVPDQTWTWVDFPDSKCMNGTPTGLGININPDSDRLFILFMGGNACFNLGSCYVTSNPDGYGADKFGRDSVPNNGIFDRNNAQNIFKDDSYVYLPYCTGDTFAGTNPDSELLGQRYSFVGHTNLGHFLRRLVPTFPNVRHVMLVGVSAGAFGATINFDQVANAFGPDVALTLIADSGPPASADYLPACLQRHFAETWGTDGAMPTDCSGCTNAPDGSFAEAHFRFLLDKYPQHRFAMISSSEDNTIRGFWGFGRNDCATLLPGNTLPPGFPGADYQAALEDLRDRIMLGAPNAALYMPFSTGHVWLDGNLSTETHHGVVLEDWIRGALDRDPTWGHVPTP